MRCTYKCLDCHETMTVRKPDDMSEEEFVESLPELGECRCGGTAVLPGVKVRT